MRRLANGLSAFRGLCAVGVPIFILREHWSIAALCFALGFFSDAADGEVVRRAGLPDDPKGAVWDHSTDAALTATTMISLIVTGHMNMWIGVVVVVGTIVILGFINKIPKGSSGYFFRRHAHYIHPFSYALLLSYMLLVMISLATDNVWPYAVAYVMVVAVISYVKRNHIKSFLVDPSA